MIHKIPEFLRFAIAGGAGFLVSFVLTFVLTEYAGLWYGLSYAIAAFVGWVVIFVLNMFVTFRDAHRGDLFARFSTFIATYFSSFVLNAFIAILLTGVFGVHYLISIVVGSAIIIALNFLVSKNLVFIKGGTHPFIARAVALAKTHVAALVLALVAALIVFTPTVLLWMEPEYQGIEIMMLDAETHYFARVHQVYEGDLALRDTYVPTNAPYATPALGEDIVAFFGKLFGLDAARAAVVSKPFSVAAIVLLIYALAYSLSRSKKASLIATAIPIFGYSLITFSPQPFIDLFTNHSTAGPFIVFSRLVNPSLSAILLFGSLVLIYRNLFEDRATWRNMTVLGVLVGASLYMSPYIFSFVGALLFLTFVWFAYHHEYALTRYTFFAGAVALLVAVPFLLNTVVLHGLPQYEHLAKFLGVVSKHEFVLGMLLPLVALVVALFWPKQYARPARLFLLLAFASLALVLNQQLITGTMIQVGHYHWYITKPLAGIVAGLLFWYAIQKFLPIRVVRVAFFLILAALIYNSLGFFAPWYKETRVLALSAQRFGPLVHYLNSVPKEVVWANSETSDYIPIYTNDDVPNNANLGSYPLPEKYFDEVFFLGYRLRGVTPKDFEATIRDEALTVSGRLWGVWLQDLIGNAANIPESEYARLALGYADFYQRPMSEVWKELGVTLVVTEDKYPTAVYSSLKKVTDINTFEVYRVE